LDSDGKFEFPDIACGSVNLWILSEKVSLPDRLAALTLNAGESAEQILVAKPACRVMADLSEFSDKIERWFRDSSNRGIIDAAMCASVVRIDSMTTAQSGHSCH
jgi:hypothetical protein